jgi:type IV pilus assembly protein PilN
MIKQKKFKAFSNFAFKGVIAAVAVIYVLLFGLSFWNIHSYNNKLVNYDKIVSNHALKSKQRAAVAQELGAMTKALELSKTIKSNKDFSYRILAQVASSVPKRVRFTKIDFNGSNRIQLTGFAASDQDILKLIANLSKQKLIEQASLSSMKLPNQKAGEQAQKGFRIICKLGRKV